MSYSVRLTPTAEKSLKEIPVKIAGQIVRKLEQLGDAPRPRGCEKIRGDKERFRIHSGNYRIIYEVRDDILLVLVIRIDHRQGVYKLHRRTL